MAVLGCDGSVGVKEDELGTARAAICDGEPITGRIPAVGSIRYRASGASTYVPHCTGTLITQRHVLTAAHCVNLDDAGGLVGAYQFVVFPGPSLPPETFAVDAAARYPLWSRGHLGAQAADVAVLTLSATVSATSATALPLFPLWDEARYSTLRGRRVEQVGFGLTPEPSVDLRRADNRILDVLRRTAPDEGTAYEIQTVCQRTAPGDSGGPMLVWPGAGAMVVGVTSMGTGADPCTGTVDLAAFVGAGAARAFVLGVVGDAYVASGARLAVVDLADPRVPRTSGVVGVRGHARGIAVAGGSAIVAAGSHAVLVDVSDPTRPTVRAQVGVCNAAEAVGRTGPRAFAVLSTTGLAMVTLDGAGGMRIAGRLRFIGGDDGGAAEMVSAPALCEAGSGMDGDGCRSGAGRCTGRPRLLATGSGRAYVVRGERLYLLDVERPEEPSAIDSLDLAFRPAAVRVADGRIYLNGDRSERVVVDASEDSLRLAGGHDLEEWVAGVRFGEGVACRLARDILEVARVEPIGTSTLVAGDGRGVGGLPGAGEFGSCGR